MTAKQTTIELTTAELKEAEAYVDAMAMTEQDLVDAAWNYFDAIRLGSDVITLTKTNGDVITMTKTNNKIQITVTQTVRTPSDQLTTGVPDDSKIS